jgi:hypothetical protein
MLTKVKSFTFSPNLVDARLSTTALALNRLSRRAFVDVSFSEKSSQRFFNEMYGSTMSLNFPRPGEIERPLSPMALSLRHDNYPIEGCCHQCSNKTSAS